MVTKKRERSIMWKMRTEEIILITYTQRMEYGDIEDGLPLQNVHLGVKE